MPKFMLLLVNLKELSNFEMETFKLLRHFGLEVVRLDRNGLELELVNLFNIFFIYFF